MTEAEKIAVLEELMELEEGTLTTETLLSDIEEWDSLAKLSLMATTKKTFKRNLTADEIREFKTIADICNYWG